MLKFLFVLKIFKYLSCQKKTRKRLDKKAKVNFRSYDVTAQTTDNYNSHISQYLKK